MRALLVSLLAVLALLPAAPAVAQTAPPPGRPTLGLTLADDGRTVTVQPGTQLRVELAGTPGAVWEGLDDGGPTLHTVRWAASEGQPLTAAVDALTPGRYGGLDGVRPQTLSARQVLRCTQGNPPCAAAERVWSVQVVVEDGPADTADPGCSRVAVAFPSPPVGSAVVTASDDGRTVVVREGGYLDVFLDGCDVQPTVPRGGRPLYRERASFDRTVSHLSARFRALTPGTTTVTSSSDARCLHRTDASGDGVCAVAQQAFSVTVEVLAEGASPTPSPAPSPTPAPSPCSGEVTLTGPARVAAQSAVLLTGTAPAGQAVQVLFRRRDTDTFAIRRELTAGPDGRYAVTWTAADDHRWYARTARCDSAPGLTQARPVITGPALVRRGSTVTLRVTAVAGVRTTVFLRGAGEPFSARRSLDGSGTVTYVAASDQRWYALTRDVASTPGLTQVR